LRFPNDDGLLFNHVWGGDHNVSGIRRNTMRIDLTTGYLFRPTTPNGGVKNSSLTSSAAEPPKSWSILGLPRIDHE
jgi:hypothetical protein